MASPADSRTTPLTASLRPALRRWIESAAFSIASVSASSSLAGTGRREAVGQTLEQARADLLLQRLDAARHRGMADAQRLGRRRQRALARERQEHPQIVPIGVLIQLQLFIIVQGLFQIVD